jgi:hypothetical protein
MPITWQKPWTILQKVLLMLRDTIESKERITTLLIGSNDTLAIE